MTELVFNNALIKKYDKSGPRYTSYPTAIQFSEDFGEKNYYEQVAVSNQRNTPLSLYFHIPFCDTICYYCGCNKIVTKNRNHAQPYLDAVHKELALQGKLFKATRIVRQLHWGGGTPTFISHEQMTELMRQTRRHFTLLDDDSGEYSIELDPREVNAASISLLRKLGFNRISLGVQDFNPKVQQAVNRIQSYNETRDVVIAARKNEFHSVSLDLIYGLPFQTVKSFDETVDKVLELEPDRLSVFNYAHLPEMFKTQRQINSDDLPSAEDKLAILHHVTNKLIDAGYEYIGMDHFAKPTDELAIAQKERKLYRNFQGYSTNSDCDLVALGITSIGKVADSYSQNIKTIKEYTQVIESDHLPVYRGIALSEDDILRREVINQLICHFELNFNHIEKDFAIDFSDYFADELKQIKEMEVDKLLELAADKITVLPEGKLLIRNICMVFDIYLKKNKEQRFSKVI
ncbi:MAG: oxygen-independent coproporphyrinogen III oxidase [Gammaproteobacteria bacterium]|nr:oxygen-independent coproporphyrinogen III oxidase [Gammaproteobacteria bacterium]